MNQTLWEATAEVRTWLGQSDDAIAEAMQARERWAYIQRVATAALAGQVIDRSLPQVIAAPRSYAEQAMTMVAALNDWVATHHLAAPGVRRAG